MLELLVALLVVVLITSMVTLTVSSGGQDIRLEAKVRNLADVASYALDEAQMTGQDYGLLLQRDDSTREPRLHLQLARATPRGLALSPTRQELFAAAICRRR